MTRFDNVYGWERVGAEQNGVLQEEGHQEEG